MMLFNRKMQPDCSYCRYGSTLGCGDYICSKRGVISDADACSSFRYEPTKREPEPTPKIMKANYSPEDFSI